MCGHNPLSIIIKMNRRYASGSESASEASETDSEGDSEGGWAARVAYTRRITDRIAPASPAQSANILTKLQDTRQYMDELIQEQVCLCARVSCVCMSMQIQYICVFVCCARARAYRHSVCVCTSVCVCARLHIRVLFFVSTTCVPVTCAPRLIAVSDALP